MLSNDRGPDDDPLTAVLDSDPTNGRLTLHPDGSFTYTPKARAKGTDSFTYFAQDPAGPQTRETVTIQLTDKKHKKRQ